jgi:hypothetical protein
MITSCGVLPADDELVEGVSSGEVVVGSVSMKVMVVVMMAVHCHHGGRQHKQKCSRSNQPEFRHDRSPFTADVGAFFAISSRMRFRKYQTGVIGE